MAFWNVRLGPRRSLSLSEDDVVRDATARPDSAARPRAQAHGAMPEREAGYVLYSDHYHPSPPLLLRRCPFILRALHCSL